MQVPQSIFPLSNNGNTGVLCRHIKPILLIRCRNKPPFMGRDGVSLNAEPLTTSGPIIRSSRPDLRAFDVPETLTARSDHHSRKAYRSLLPGKTLDTAV